MSHAMAAAKMVDARCCAEIISEAVADKMELRPPILCRDIWFPRDRGELVKDIFQAITCGPTEGKIRNFLFRDCDWGYWAADDAARMASAALREEAERAIAKWNAWHAAVDATNAITRTHP
jgi:hypothetical protein